MLLPSVHGDVRECNFSKVTLVSQGFRKTLNDDPGFDDAAFKAWTACCVSLSGFNF